MRIFISFILLTSLPFLSTAQDLDNGQQLHSEQCVKCHGDSVYTRADRRVTSLPKLGTQVRFCKNNIGIQWFEDEVEDVIQHLNQQYYHF